jgi:hypothetical protein
MSAPTTTGRTSKKALAVLTTGVAASWLAVTVMTPAVAAPLESTAAAHTVSASNPGPPNYPNYDPRYEVPRTESVVAQGNGLETTSVALGALGGIALAGAGLGLTLGVQRRRDHTAFPQLR